MKAKVPARCTLCTSRAQRDGKVFDLHSYKKSDIVYFATQHCGGQMHRRLIASRKSQEMAALHQNQLKPCQGMCLSDEKNALHPYLQQFKLWVAWKAVASEWEKHSYSVDSAGNHTLRHQDCSGTCHEVVGKGFVCTSCLSLYNLRKNMVKCGLKKFAADLLFSRIFESEERQQQCIGAINETVIGQRHSNMVQKVIAFKNHELQQWVRASFLSIRADQRNDVLSCYMSSVVTPCLKLNLTTAGQQRPILLNVQATFENFLARNDSNELDKIRVQLAQACMSGRLDSNPMIQGLIMTCLRVADRQDAGHQGAGLTTGRIAKSSPMYSPEARELACEAGRLLCLASRGNRHLLKIFGAHTRPFSAHKNNNYSAALQKASLPIPFNAIDRPGALGHNFLMIDQQLSVISDTSGRNWHAFIFMIYDDLIYVNMIYVCYCMYSICMFCIVFCLFVFLSIGF